MMTDYGYAAVRVGDLIRITDVSRYDLDNRIYANKVGFVVSMNDHWVTANMAPDLQLFAVAARDQIEVIWRRPDFDEFDKDQAFANR